MRPWTCFIFTSLLCNACGGGKGGDESTATTTATTTAGTTSVTSSGTASSGGMPTTGGSASATGTSGSDSSGGASSGGGDGSTTTPDPSTGSTGSTGDSAGSSGGSSGGSTGGVDLCPDGTCILFDNGPCEAPTGPQGNGCCKCGPDDKCSAFCRCAAPDTPIATPTGDRAIASLRPGDLVYSEHRGQIVAVPVLQISKLPAPRHQVMRTELASGVVLSISPGHPTADGRSFADLEVGDLLGGVAVRDARIVPYAHAFTHDILPDSDTGTYYAGGAQIGSTLFVTGATPACR